MDDKVTETPSTFWSEIRAAHRELFWTGKDEGGRSLIFAGVFVAIFHVYQRRSVVVTLTNSAWHEIGLDGPVFLAAMYLYLLFRAPFSLLRKERQNAVALKKEKEEEAAKFKNADDDNKKLLVTQTLAALSVQGYELGPDGFDSWTDRCTQYLEEVFGEESLELKVFKQKAIDQAVVDHVNQQKFRIAKMKGGKPMHPNAVIREDIPVVHQIVVLRWAAGRFLKKYPLTTL